MKKLLALLLAVIMVCSLVACTGTPDPSGSTTNPQLANSNPTDPKPTDPKPTDPKPTDPKPTDPKPTEPKPTEPLWPDGRIVIEAEKPSDKYVDLVDRNDMMGLPMYQPGELPHSQRPLAEDGLQYCTRSTTRIVFCAFDSYTYTFEVEEAGTYSFRVLGSCDRDSPLIYSVNGGEEAIGYFVRNDYQSYDEIELGTVELVAGTNTITITITENKNHNFWVDCYYMVPATPED